MGISGLLPFLEKASKKGNIGEFSGCSVAIDSYCWLHKGAFACADKLVRGEETDMHIKYCMKYVNMLLSRNIKPILVFDGRHLPAKAMTESKRRESRDVAKKRAAELLRLGQVDEARSYMRRCVDITHEMALALIKECRARNVDCIVAPYEADAQLAYLNVKNIAQVVITEDSDLILFGCTKVFFKMDLDGNGTLVDACKLPLTMKCPIEKYRFSQFRRMCILSGCDYLASLPGIGLAKARQFVTTTQDDDFANALKKLPSFFNKSNLVVSDEYRIAFLRAEATFLHQLVYCPLARHLVPLNDPHDEGTDPSLCSNAGEMLDSDVAFELALGNLDPFTLRKMDDWHPDNNSKIKAGKTSGWNQVSVAGHTSIWSPIFTKHLQSSRPWSIAPTPSQTAILTTTKARSKLLRLPSKVVPETQEFDSLTIENLSEMYCVEPTVKRPKLQENLTLGIIEDSQPLSTARNPFAKTTGKYQTLNSAPGQPTHKEITDSPKKERSPILENKERSFRKVLKNGSYSVLKKLSKFQRTIVDEENVVESKFFNNAIVEVSDDESSSGIYSAASKLTIDEENPGPSSQKENRLLENGLFDINETCLSNNSTSTDRVPHSQLSREECNNIASQNNITRNSDHFMELSQGSIIENTYPYEELITPTDSQLSFGESSTEILSGEWKCKDVKPPSSGGVVNGWASRRPVGLQKQAGSKGPGIAKQLGCKAPGLSKRPANQPTLLTMFSFQRKQMLKK